MYCQSNNWWRFHKILWPSQNILTLIENANVSERAKAMKLGQALIREGVQSIKRRQ